MFFVLMDSTFSNLIPQEHEYSYIGIGISPSAYSDFDFDFKDRLTEVGPQVEHFQPWRPCSMTFSLSMLTAGLLTVLPQVAQLYSYRLKLAIFVFLYSKNWIRFLPPTISSTTKQRF